MVDSKKTSSLDKHNILFPFSINPYLELLEVGSHSPSFVVGQSVPVLLEEGVDTGNSPIPRILEIFQSESPVLCRSFLSLQTILRPHPLTVDKLALPRLDVAVEVRDELIIIMAHTRTEVSDSDVCLFGPAEIGLGNENVTHREHAEASKFLWCVEDNRREAARHL